MIHALQRAVESDSYHLYKRYAETVYAQPPVNLRDLLRFKAKDAAVPLDDVESITDIRRRLVAQGIALGALRQEAHETLSLARNRIGPKQTGQASGREKGGAY